MRILITGGAGFIGSNLARAALAEGVDVAILDDLSNGYRENIDGLDVRFIEGTLLDPAAVTSALDGVESVVHLGALGSVPRSIKDPLSSHAANATGTLTLLEQVRTAGVEHVITASSSSVYGANPALPKGEREWVRPMSPYAVSKLATEQYTLAYQNSYGLRTLAFRFFNVFGPWQRASHVYAAAIPIFIDAMLAGKPVPVHGDGEQSRDFTYVGSVCRVILDAVNRRVSHPEPVNLAFGTNTTINRVISELGRTMGVDPEVKRLDPRPGDVRHSQADSSSLRALFPGVQCVPMEDGLIKTLEWHVEEARLKNIDDRHAGSL